MLTTESKLLQRVNDESGGRERKARQQLEERLREILALAGIRQQQLDVAARMTALAVADYVCTAQCGLRYPELIEKD